MTAEQIRKMSSEELEKELISLKDQLFKLRFQNATHQLDNPSQISSVKKDIARVKTIIREQQLKAHDENNECRIGDKVKVMETKPISKDKRWRLVSIVEKAK